MCVLSVKTLKVTGSTRSPAPSLSPAPRESVPALRAKLSLIRSLALSGEPSTGLVPCFSSQSEMTSTSKMVPEGVQTGFLKGWREAAQKLKGRRRKGAAVRLVWAPVLAEKASEEDHSEWVIWGSLV